MSLTNDGFYKQNDYLYDTYYKRSAFYYGHAYPHTNDSSNLGSSSRKWNDFYVNNTYGDGNSTYSYFYGNGSFLTGISSVWTEVGSQAYYDGLANTTDGYISNGSTTFVRHSDPTYIVNDGDGSTIIGYQEYTPFPAFPQIGGVGKMTSSGKGSIVAGYAWSKIGGNSTIQALGDGSFAGGATSDGNTNITSAKSGGFSWGAGDLMNNHISGFAFGEDIILNGTNKKEGFGVGAQNSVAESYGISVGFSNNVATGGTFGAIALGKGNYVSGVSSFGIGQNNFCYHDQAYLIGKGLTSSGINQAKFGYDDYYFLANTTGIYSNHSGTMSITGNYAIGDCYINLSGGIAIGTNCTSI